MLRLSRDTPLHYAAFVGDEEKAKECLQPDDYHNKMLTMPTKDGLLPLDCAVPRGHFKVIKALVHAHRSTDKYTIENPQGYHPILAAAHWWCNFVNGITPAEKDFTNKPEEDFPAIMHLLIDFYQEICDPTIGLDLVDNVHHTNALFYIIRIMALKESKMGDINEHKKQAAIIAKKLIEKGLSLDIPNSTTGLTARKLVKKHNIPAIESYEENARLKREKAANNTFLSQPPRPSKKSQKKPMPIISQEKKRSFFPKKSFSLPDTISLPPLAKATPVTFTKQTLVKKNKKTTSTKKNPSTLFLKYKLGPEKPFSDADVEKIIRYSFSPHINDKNLMEVAKEIVVQLKPYPVTQNIKTDISNIIISNLYIAGYTYKGFFCRTKVPLLAFDPDKAKHTLDQYFKTARPDIVLQSTINQYRYG